MRWHLSDSCDPVAREIADRHYNRQKIGSNRFVPPGRCLVLLADNALWATSWPYAEFVRHAWAGAWINSLFRKEGDGIASEYIREAVACTRFKYGDAPALGMITFINPEFVKPIIRRGVEVWGYSYLCAGFRNVGKTKGGLLAYQLLPQDMPEPEPAIGFQLSF